MAYDMTVWRRLLYALLTLIHGVQNALVQKALQQPDQNQEVDDLRGDGKPVNQHVYFTVATTWFQNGLAKIRISDTTKQ